MINKNELFVSDISLHDYAGDMSKEWYVGFSYTRPLTHERTAVQVRLKINSFKKRNERYLSGNAVVKVVKNALNNGWLPYSENLKQFSSGEKSEIQKHLYLVHYNFFVYLMAIYHTGIRPKEALMLRIKDVNLNNREIIIKPNMQIGNSKI